MATKFKIGDEILVKKCSGAGLWYSSNIGDIYQLNEKCIGWHTAAWFIDPPDIGVRRAIREEDMELWVEDNQGNITSDFTIKMTVTQVGDVKDYEITFLNPTNEQLKIIMESVYGKNI